MNGGFYLTAWIVDQAEASLMISTEGNHCGQPTRTLIGTGPGSRPSLCAFALLLRKIQEPVCVRASKKRCHGSRDCSDANPVTLSEAAKEGMGASCNRYRSASAFDG
jgi:hypothetical protein